MRWNSWLLSLLVLWSATTVAAGKDPRPQPVVWQSVPYDATQFAGQGSMVWTVEPGHVVRQRYALDGHTLHWTLNLADSQISDRETPLYVRIPGGYRSAGPTGCSFWYSQWPGYGGIGLAYTFGSDHFRLFQANTGETWAAKELYLILNCEFEIQ